MTGLSFGLYMIPYDTTFDDQCLMMCKDILSLCNLTYSAPFVFKQVYVLARGLDIVSTQTFEPHMICLRPVKVTSHLGKC